jgi:hypothetical protein
MGFFENRVYIIYIYIPNPVVYHHFPYRKIILWDILKVYVFSSPESGKQSLFGCTFSMPTQHPPLAYPQDISLLYLYPHTVIMSLTELFLVVKSRKTYPQNPNKNANK